jgi:DNA-binding LacI/PurR family transcriptional regulator
MAHKDVADKSREMFHSIKEMIVSGQYSPGYKIPSIRSFMDRFGLSYGSARRVIESLCDEGLLKKHVGQGTFVKEMTKSAKNGQKTGGFRISVLLAGGYKKDNVGVYSTVFLGVQEAAEVSDCSILMKHIDFSSLTLDEFNKYANMSDGMLLLSEYDTCDFNILPHIPVVGVCMHNNYKSMISTVDMDPFCAAEESLRFFSEKEIKKVSIITSDRPAYINRADIMKCMCDNIGKEVEILVAPEDISFRKDTAYYFTTGSLLMAHSHLFMEKSGKELNEEHVVIGIDGKHRMFPFADKSPAITADWRQVGKIALEECINRITNPGSVARRIYLPGRLTV